MSPVPGPPPRAGVRRTDQGARGGSARPPVAARVRPVIAPPRPFRRLAIVNRGEPAMRLINAVREWNAEQGRAPGVRTIAVHTAVDRHAMFVREADEAVLIGPDDPDDFGPVALPRLRRAGARAASRAAPTRCGPAGASSPRRPTSPRCAAPGHRVRRPVLRGDAPARRQDRLEAARRGGRRADGAVERRRRSPTSTARARRAEKIGYPLMVKATAGGGGRGIR